MRLRSLGWWAASELSMFLSQKNVWAAQLLTAWVYETALPAYTDALSVHLTFTRFLALKRPNHLMFPQALGKNEGMFLAHMLCKQNNKSTSLEKLTLTAFQPYFLQSPKMGSLTTNFVDVKVGQKGFL